MALALALSAAGARADGTVTVTPAGIGPIRIGMPLAALAEALGEPITVPDDPDERACFYVYPRRFPGVGFMVDEGRLRRIDVRSEGAQTAEGIRVGDPVSKVEAAFGSRLKDEPHHYTGPEDRYLTVTFEEGTLALRFETHAGRIVVFYAGSFQQVQYVEGCL
jgi:hypothetical protein